MSLKEKLNPSSLRSTSRQWRSPERTKVLLAAIFPFLLFLGGCAGVLGGQTTPPSQTYTISGSISPAAGGSGATVSLNGAASLTTTSDSSGNYSFTAVANGAYVITPSKGGYVFSPTSSSATVSGANLTGVNFTATAGQTHTVGLAWVGSTSPVVGYNVYRSTVNGSSYVMINSGLVTTVSYTDSAVQSGTTYYYVTTAVDSNGLESAFSNQASAFIP